jgi:beta-glucosidase
MTLYLDAARSLEERVDNLLAQMTLDEKLAQIGSFWVYEVLENGVTFSPAKAEKLLAHGIGHVTRIGGASNVTPKQSAEVANAIQRYICEHTRLKIPAIIHEECCSGYMAFGATVFPQAIGVASAWEPELVADMARVIQRQMRSVGAHHALAPVLDVTRDARWGRTEETFGEDPYLVASIGSAFIQGLQGDDWRQGIVATAKHFVGYGMSEGGMNWAPPHIPAREMREVYLFPFEAAVREARIASVMNAYHELDGVPCGASRELLTDMLRGEWGFDGTLVSDYFAVNQLHSYHRVAPDKAGAAHVALDAGIDVELPATDCYGAPLREAVLSGSIPLELIDTAVKRVLAQKFSLGLFEQPYVDAAAVAFDTPDDRALAKKLAGQSLVLLRNEGDLLPLAKTIKSLAVIGPNADSTRNLFGDYAYPAHIETILEMRSANIFGMSGKSADVVLPDDFISVISILDAIKAKVSPQTTVTYAQGCAVLDDSRDGFAAAVEAARNSDLAILVMGDKAGLTDGCTSGEALDRADLDLPGVQPELVRAIYETGTPIVLVLVNGRPVTLNWMADEIPAILEAWFPGEEGANAIADALFGDLNPGGKLPISFPRSVGQVPIYYGHKPSGGRSMWKGDYVETPSTPQYPFGYGLSYTRFAYENLQVAPAQAKSGDTVTVSVTLRNTGTRAGDEVVQLYARLNDTSITRPVKELKGYQRVHLAPGAAATVTFALAVDSLGFYDRAMRFVVEPCPVDIHVGGSSADGLRGGFTIVGAPAVIAEKCFFTEVQVSG